MAIAAADIMEHFTQGILGAKNFDDIPKWEVENHDLTRTFFSDRLRDHANDPFNRRAIERLCSLYRSQFGIFKMKEPIAVDTSCTYANQVISYIENLTGMDLSILENFDKNLDNKTNDNKQNDVIFADNFDKSKRSIALVLKAQDNYNLGITYTKTLVINYSDELKAISKDKLEQTLVKKVDPLFVCSKTQIKGNLN